MPRAYRSDGRQERARQTRAGILAAAAELMEAKGYGGATMRAIAVRAGVAVPTVEAAFGTKARLLKAAIDVAIAGDDEQVTMLDRPWARRARAATRPRAALAIAAEVLGPAQQRSYGLVLAALEAAATDPELAAVAEELLEQRRRTAGWLVGTVAATAALRDPYDLAVDTVWALMDPALFHRLVLRRGWTVPQYQEWFARSAERLLISDPHDSPEES
jgi:TetR/AcrR family transcriptional regulator, regulator of autoinduction and epiphytic fitness